LNFKKKFLSTIKVIVKRNFIVELQGVPESLKPTRPMQGSRDKLLLPAALTPKGISVGRKSS